MEYLEKAAKQAKQVVKAARYQMEGLTEVEILARECTNSDPWYAGGTDLAELARASRDREDMYLIMKTLWARLDGRDDQWRNVYKAITAFEYLVANGSEEVVRELRAGQRAIERLENFHFKDERGRDQGINVRQGSQRLVAVRVATPTGDARPDASRPPARATTDRPPRSAPRVRRRARIAACLPGIDRPPNVSRAPVRPAPLTPRRGP
jgi:epsin